MLFAVSAFAQVSERVEVNVVNVDVTVLDRSGKPVDDLTKDDFAVFEDGQQQKITHFAFVKRDERSHQRSVVVVIDQRFLSNTVQRNRAIAALENTVANAEDGSTWCVVTLNDPAGLKTIIQPTADRKLAAAALESVRKGASPPEQVSLAIPFDPNDDFQCETAECVMRDYGIEPVGAMTAWFVAAANHAIRRVRMMPGSRDILFVTDAAVYDPVMFGPIVRDAGAANARVFVLAPSGPGGGRGGYWIAKETGGLYLGSNRPADSAQAFEQATGNEYELAYSTGPDDGKYHHIDVKVLRAGRFTLLHRNGYFRVPRR